MSTRCYKRGFLVSSLITLVLYLAGRVDLTWSAQLRVLYVFVTFSVGVIAVYYLAMILTAHIVMRNSKMPGEVLMLGGLFRALALGGILVSFVHAQGQLTVFAMFFSMFGGMLLGWSLQAPVSGLAAWVLVTIKRPFRIGDRVNFPSLGLTGDVTEMGGMYTVLNQVGGSIGSEEAVGRNVLIPNAMLFSNVVVNFTVRKEASFILDEIVIRMTYDSDWDTATSILVEAAKAVTFDIIRATGQEPYVRSDIYDYGILMRLRYMNIATERPRISSLILEVVYKSFQRNPNVDFAIPYVYSFKRGMHLQDSAARDTEQILVTCIKETTQLRSEAEQKPDDIMELAESIQESGLLQPLIVRRELQGDRFTLVAGHQRLKACLYLGWERVPALVQNKIGSDVLRFQQRGNEAQSAASSSPSDPIA